MNKLQKRVQQRGQGGFTLIELLVVIAILAILAGVVVFAVGNSTKNAEKAACKTERASIITAYAAAKTASLSGPAETYTNYLSNAAQIKYFTLPAVAVTGAPRLLITADNPDSSANGGCAAITAAEVGL